MGLCSLCRVAKRARSRPRRRPERVVGRIGGQPEPRRGCEDVAAGPVRDALRPDQSPLYAQRARKGLRRSRPRRSGRAYTLAVRLFAGCIVPREDLSRSTSWGRPRALVEARSRISVVAAGLLPRRVHARRVRRRLARHDRCQASSGRRRRRRGVRGSHRAIHDFRWRTEALSQLRKTLAGFAGADRDVLLIASGERTRRSPRSRRPLLRRRRAEAPAPRAAGGVRGSRLTTWATTGLSGSLAEAFAACRAGRSRVARIGPGWRGSFLVAPRSYRPSLRIRLRQWRTGMVRLFSGADERHGAAD
jgi:hypothetical protein